MKNVEKTTAVAPPPKKKAPLASKPKVETPAPLFVEAERMFDRFLQLTEEMTRKAFENFVKRGGGFGREFDDWFKAESELLRPVPIELVEKNGGYFVDASVPGFKPGEIEISIDDDLLTISGLTERNFESEKENLVYTDFSSNRFFRQMPLPQPVDAENAEAKLEDGILHIMLPKMKLPEAKHIAVSA